MSVKSQTRDPGLKSLPEDLCSWFLRPEKNPSTSAGFAPANLGSLGEHGAPRPPRPTTTSLYEYILCLFNFEQML